MQTRKQFGLNAMPTVMVMGGGWGVLKGRKEELLTYLASWSKDIQLLICLGTNEKARQQLLEEEIFRQPNIHLIGYTNEINKLMDISDLLITKPGGMTCTEAMAKGIPMLFYSPIPGQEEMNCQYFQDQGYGQMITSLEMVDHWFKLLLEQYPELSKRRITIREHQKFGAQDCSRAIIQYLKLSDQRPYQQASTTTPLIQWY